MPGACGAAASLGHGRDVGVVAIFIHMARPRALVGCIVKRERQIISARTKVALAAAKARGQALGNPRLSEARSIANAAHKLALRQNRAWAWLRLGRDAKIRSGNAAAIFAFCSPVAPIATNRSIA